MDDRRFKMFPRKPRILAGCGSRSVGVLRRTISASNHRLDSSTHSKPSRIARKVKQGEMQQQLGYPQEDTGRVKEERDRALRELWEMRTAADEASARLSDSLNSAKKSLSDSNRDLKIKEAAIQALERELEKANQSRRAVSERDALIETLREDLGQSKSSEAQAMSSLSRCRERIQELESEIENRKESETKLFYSFAAQTKQIEQTKIGLEESKIEVASLRERIKLLEKQSSGTNGELVESLQSELLSTKHGLSCAREAERLASSKAESLLQELNSLKNDWKSAVESEEKTRKAMDDLASALKEVATEANLVKDRLNATELQLEHAKTAQSKYSGLASESKNETDRLKNTIVRLRTEAEDSLLAWNEKEVRFVNCIKRAEDERASAQLENTRLVESLHATEIKTQKSREENHKLRDILKQALNESNVAKEAAGIARAENAKLQDCLSEKDNALDILTRDNENLRINEAAARETVKELKRLLSVASADHKEVGGTLGEENPMLIEQSSGSSMDKASSFDLMELGHPDKEKELVEEGEEEDPEKAEALRGSIFDTDSPGTSSVVFHHQKGSSFAFTDDGETISSEDYDHVDGNSIEDMENGRSLQRKKRAYLLQKFGNLIRRGSFHHRKEPSME